MQQLVTELDALLYLGRAGYAEKCSADVETGIRSQKILTEMKSLRTELRLCHFKTRKACSCDSETSPAPQRPVQVTERVERPLPEWITKAMQNIQPLTAEQQRRLKLQAESSVLTLAGRTLSMPTNQTPTYHEIFRLHNKDHTEAQPGTAFQLESNLFEIPLPDLQACDKRD